MTRPPLVADDAVLRCVDQTLASNNASNLSWNRFIFRSSKDDIQLWLRTSNISIQSATTSQQLPAHIGLWLHLFDGTTKIDKSFLTEHADDIKKGLPDHAHHLLAEFQSACASDEFMGTTADYSFLSSDVGFSLLFCSYAQQLHDMPADPTNNHLRITHWMALYNCLFSRVWRSREVTELLVRWVARHSLMTTTHSSLTGTIHTGRFTVVSAKSTPYEATSSI